MNYKLSHRGLVFFDVHMMFKIAPAQLGWFFLLQKDSVKFGMKK